MNTGEKEDWIRTNTATDMVEFRRNSWEFVSQIPWVIHKTANVLDKLPKKLQRQAKEMLHEIYFAPDRKEAEKQMKKFVNTFDDKYPKVTRCLVKDKEVLLTLGSFEKNSDER